MLDCQVTVDTFQFRRGRLAGLLGQVDLVAAGLDRHSRLDRIVFARQLFGLGFGILILTGQLLGRLALGVLILGDRLLGVLGRQHAGHEQRQHEAGDAPAEPPRRGLHRVHGDRS